MQKLSKWQLFKWDLQRDWQNSFIRRYSLIIWAYLTLFWASLFAENEFSRLLRLNHSGMLAMNPKQRENYSTCLAKVRAKIGGHKFDTNITMEEIK